MCDSSIEPFEDDNLKENTINLVKFLRELADSMEHGNLPSSHRRRVGEFFMKYKFQEQSDNDTTSDEDFTQEEFTKFLCMGWYAYRVLLNKDTLE